MGNQPTADALAIRVCSYKQEVVERLMKLVELQARHCCRVRCDDRAKLLLMTLPHTTNTGERARVQYKGRARHNYSQLVPVRCLCMTLNVLYASLTPNNLQDGSQPCEIPASRIPSRQACKGELVCSVCMPRSSLVSDQSARRSKSTCCTTSPVRADSFGQGSRATSRISRKGAPFQLSVKICE